MKGQSWMAPSTQDNQRNSPANNLAGRLDEWTGPLVLRGLQLVFLSLYNAALYLTIKLTALSPVGELPVYRWTMRLAHLWPQRPVLMETKRYGVDNVTMVHIAHS